MSEPSCPDCGADLRSFEQHARTCSTRQPSSPSGAGTIRERLRAIQVCRNRLRAIGEDLNRGAAVPNLAERIWDECDAIHVALRAVEAALPLDGSEAQGWQPIESAPKDGTPLLLSEPGELLGYTIPHFTAGFWSPSRGYRAKGFWQDIYRDLIVTPTHWMLLPAPQRESASSVDARFTPPAKGKAIGSAGESS